VNKLRETNKKLFSKYLLITNLAISTTFSGLGDFLEQTYEVYAGYEERRDKIRTLKMAFTGLPVGFFCHHWYMTLDKYLPMRDKKSLIKKFLLDQLIGSPVYIAIFLISIGILKHWTAEQFKKDFVEKGISFYKAEWYVRPPAQIFNFYFVPSRFRILYDSIVSLGFDTYFSFVTYKEIREKKLNKKEDS